MRHVNDFPIVQNSDLAYVLLRLHLMNWVIIILLIFLIVGMASILHAQTVSSDHAPKVERLQNSIIIPHDVNEVEKDGQRSWEYKEIRIPDKGQVFTEIDATTAVKSQQDKQTAADDAAALLATLSYKDVDAHVDTTFAALSIAQRTSLKKLYKAVLYLLKEQQE